MQRLKACLHDLPTRLRLVLELTTGVETSRPLRLTAVAKYLRITVAQTSRLQRRALQRLRMTALTHTCGKKPLPAPSLLFAFVSFGPSPGSGAALSGAGGPRATGGVDAAREAKLSPLELAGPATVLAPGAKLQPDSSAKILIIAAALTAALLMALVVADQLGQGPRHREWRHRWMRRLPWT